MRFASFSLLFLVASILGSQVALAQDDAPAEEHPLITDVKDQLGERSHEKPFIMVIDLQCKQGKRADFIAAMSEAIVGTRKEEGNSIYRLIADASDKTKFQMFEQWKNMDGFLAHMKQPYIAALGNKLPDLLDGEPTLKVMVPIFVKK